MRGCWNRIWCCDYTHVGCADVSWQRIFLDLAQQGHLKAWRYSMKKKNWRRGIPGCWGMRERDEGLAGEDTLLLWRKLPVEIPQDWRNLMSSWKAPCERGGQVGTSQLRFLLLYCLSFLSCAKPGDPRNLIGSREGWPLYNLITTKGFSLATGLDQRREMFSL